MASDVEHALHHPEVVAMSEPRLFGESEVRELIDKAVKSAVEETWKKVDDLLPPYMDMKTKEGRALFTKVVDHGHTLWAGCEVMKSDGMRIVRNGIWWIIFLAMFFGVAWLLNIDPSRFIKALGKGL